MKDEPLKRGLTYAEAMAYVGVKRRTFDEVWRPRLVAIRQGSSIIFDKHDLDRLFDEFKARAAEDGSQQPTITLNSVRDAPLPPRLSWPRATAKTRDLDFDDVAKKVLEQRARGRNRPPR